MITSECFSGRVARRALAWSLAGVLGCCYCALGQEAVSVDGRPLLAKMRAEGVNASLTVAPTRLVGEPNRDVADVIGALLEKQARMGRIQTTDAVFAPPADAKPEQIPELFGEWVKKNPIESDYALYAEILGTPKTGPTEIRTAIVAKSGEEVWFDRQTPESPTFKQNKPDCPMDCCVLITQRVQAALDIPRPGDEEIVDGPMERIGERKSGLPPKAEMKAMDARLATMQKERGDAKILIYPIQVNGVPDPDAAKEIVDAALKAGFGKAEASDQKPSFELERSPNELKRLWDLARAFQNCVRENKPDADYALFAEYMLNEEQHSVYAVHFVVCDRAGEWVLVDLQNSHQDDFNSVNPKSREDCTKLLARRLKQRCE